MISTLMKDIVDDQTGGTAIEYGLIVALIAIAIVGSLTAFAGEGNELWAKGTEDQTRRLHMTFFKNLLRDEQGATAIEYGLIAALIAVAAITAMTALGGELSETFTEVEDDLNEANKGVPPAAD